ncbi:uncharacterized protein si:ch211-67e16.4 isoform X2 [Trematomus bernacchii]|uniref:uncharacterized protein si:ch211-67e16.4 isoform X2 n=1 Tax=Trematomus bernacchii TaxID=40690 RepID=UPI00146A1EFF|nr:uncharacterized protein si:ch211-67e16.4 isoform X2 [Trematomus bernacchii]
MDVSIAVSLIRGQMRAVVERAVNGAVETVLAEMLKVVGVKFEELKGHVALMQRDVASLQREKAQKEKENENIRAKLRYTELKLKYYRQGVEEELEQRVSASTLGRIHPSIYLQAQRGGAGVSSTEISPSCSITNPEGPLSTSNQECSSPHSTSRRAIGTLCHSDVGDLSSDTSDLLLPVSLSLNTPTESSQDSSTVFFPVERHVAHSKDQENDCKWTVTLQPHSEGGDAHLVPPPVQALEQQSAAGSPSPHVSTQADSSTLHSSASQVKQEEEEEEICIKVEPEEEQDVMADLLLDCQLQQGHLPEPETQRSVTEWSGLPESQRNNSAAYSSAGPCTDLMPQPLSSLQSMGYLPSGIPHRQAVRPWTKDLSLYEDFKLRRNELRKRSINRRRELEKTLPQPMLADLVRERREKTRLRVARWRAKRKLQACVNQAPAPDGAAGLCQTGFPISSQHQQLRVTCAATSNSQQRQMLQSNNFLNMSKLHAANSIPFTPSSCSSSPLLRGPNMAPHQHTVTYSSSSYPQVSLLQQSISLTDTDILQ